jgi:hypothetical protein
VDIDLAEKLLRLAVDPNTTEDERRASAMALARMLHESQFLPTVRRLIETVESLTKWLIANRIALSRRLGIRLPSSL